MKGKTIIGGRAAGMPEMTLEWALSENGIQAEKTMNAVLHLIEAYTELIRVKRDKKVKERLVWLLNCVKEKIYFEDEHRLLVFFDKQFNLLGDIHSYGHDIEAQWLIDRACDVLGDIELRKEFAKIVLIKIHIIKLFLRYVFIR